MTMQQPGSDPNTNSGAAAPATAANAPATPVAAPAPVPPPAPPPSAAAGGEEAPAWLPGRLQREREAAQRALLTDLGVPDLATARARMAEAANAATASARSATLEQTIRQRVDVELAGLTDAQRTAVTAIAGTDPARLLSTIDQLRPTWGAPQTPAAAAPQPAAAPAAAPAPAPAAPPPADTAPGRTAPGGTPPATAPTFTAQYQALVKENPFAAAAFYQKHGRLIAEGK